MSVHITSLKKKKQDGLAYDELTLEKLMRYYGFEKREELLDFLRTQCLED